MHLCTLRNLDILNVFYICCCCCCTLLCHRRYRYSMKCNITYFQVINFIRCNQLCAHWLYTKAKQKKKINENKTKINSTLFIPNRLMLTVFNKLTFFSPIDAIICTFLFFSIDFYHFFCEYFDVEIL